MLVEYFVEKHADRNGWPTPAIEPGAIDALHGSRLAGQCARA